MDKNELLARAIENTFISPAPSEHDPNFESANIVDGLYALSRAIIKLGNNDASTPFGGLEGLGKAMLDSAEKIRDGLSELAEAIRESKSTD